MLALQGHSFWQADACGLICSCNACTTKHNLPASTCPARSPMPTVLRFARHPHHMQVLIPAEPWHSLPMGG